MINLTETEYLELAYKCALRSPDPSTQNGAVIIGVDGDMVLSCNMFPRGVGVTDYRLQRPQKYSYIEHAERNGVYAAAKRGMKLEGATMYCPWFACADCARGIIQSGITRVVGHQAMFDSTPDHWKESIAVANGMMFDAGIDTVLLDVKLNCQPILFNESLWYP